MKTILVLCAHTDDGEIGCGGTITRYIEEGQTVYYAAFSRASVGESFHPACVSDECREAVSVLGIPDENCFLFDYEVRKLGYSRQDILEKMVALNRDLKPDMVFFPCKEDFHQDHVTVYEEGMRAFKYSTLLGYEMPWNNLSFHARHFVPLDSRHVETKGQAIGCYRSQKHRRYMTAEFVRSLAMTRGTQIGVDYAEAFDVVRWIVA